MTLKNINETTLQLTREQRETARTRMVEELIVLLSYHHEKPLEWKYSVTDLMEMAHLAFISDQIIEDDGSNCTFRSLVRRVCLLFGMTVPSNPYSYINRVQNRKNVRARSFFEMYCWQMYRQGQSHPLLLSLSLSPSLCTKHLQGIKK